MNKFIQSKNLDYKDDPFFLEASNLIGYNKPKVGGSYLKYGKDRACDLDMSESISYEQFKIYLEKLFQNKDKLILLDAHFNKPYNKLQEIKDKLGYLDGNFKLPNNFQIDIISDYVNNLPDELKKPIQELIDNYKDMGEAHNIDNLLKIKLFIEINLYPKWSWYNLKKGVITYYDQTFNISANDYEYFYIECIYNNFRISNLITFDKRGGNNNMLYWDIDSIMINNELSYFKLLKKLMVVIKKLYFNNQFHNNEKEESIINYNTIFEFVENIGIQHNSNCSIKNLMDIYKLKILKYTKKYKKYHGLRKYLKFIKYFQKKYDEYSKIFSLKTEQINLKSKPFYSKISQQYIPYLTKFVKII